MSKRINLFEKNIDIVIDSKYSTDETVIGNYAGKPVYRKIFNLNNLYVAPQMWVETNIPKQNFDVILSARTIGTTQYPIAFDRYTDTNHCAIMHFRNVALEFSFVLVEYTKVTN